MVQKLQECPLLWRLSVSSTPSCLVYMDRFEEDFSKIPKVSRHTFLLDVPPVLLNLSLVSGHKTVINNLITAAPSERLKLLIQIQQDSAHQKFSSPLQALKQTVSENGVRALFRGSWATIVRDCPAFGIYFASYEYMVRNMSKDGKSGGLNTGQLLLAGGILRSLIFLKQNYQVPPEWYLGSSTILPMS